ncbi:hypothetical protein J1614_005331 [Plenodomus biglobosus]|nr:hypothetical protein J1614_005331 [Plenodomus biglobosus]
MSDANRAKTILQMLRFTANGIDLAFDAWSIWKGRQGMTVLDQLDTLEIDQGVYRMLNERSSNLASLADEVNPDGFHTTVAEKVAGDGTPTGSKIKPDEWNTPIDEIADDLSPGGKKVATEFRIKGNMIKILSVVLGLGVAIAMTFDLIHNWDNMTLMDKILGVLAVVVEFLSVALEILSVGIQIGLWTVGATLSAAIPVIGVVLAVIGVVIMLIGLLFGVFNKPDPPPDPVETYIEGTGRSLISGFSDAPDSQLSYSVSPTSGSPGKVTSFIIDGVNNSSSDVTITSITISMLSGDSDACLFSDVEDKIVLVSDNDPDKTSNRHVYVTPSSNVGGSLPFRTRLESDIRTYYQYDLQVGGTKKESEGLLQALVLKPAERFKAVWTSTVRSGKTCQLDVVERVKTDMFHAELLITR